MIGVRGAMGPDGRSVSPLGKGWRGPESTWPGRIGNCGGCGRTGGGAGRPGAIAAAGGVGAVGAPDGALPARGGRMGCAARPAGRSITAVPAAGAGAFSSASSVARGWLAGPPGTSAGVAVSTAAGCCRSDAGAGVLSAAACGPGPETSSGTSCPKMRRSLMATSSSIELECVFFSVTPNPGRRSRISWALTSNSRASSLIRILFIKNTTLCRGDAPYSFTEPRFSDSS